MNEKPIKNFIIIVAIIAIFSIIYLVLDRLLNSDNEEEVEYLKNYEVNEYIPTYVSDESMAKIYLNDYIKKTYYNIEGAYELLDAEYREKKFGSLDNFKNYIYSTTNLNYNLYEYYKIVNDDYIIFGVYDEKGNLFIFKTNGVMQYSVYLDDYTVEI